MVSNKELSYANSAADVAPFPGEIYARESAKYLKRHLITIKTTTKIKNMILL